MTDNRNGLTNNDTQILTGGGSGGITVESDPIYLADKPNIALKSEVATVQENVTNLSNDVIDNTNSIITNTDTILELNDNLESLSDTVDNIESIQEFKDLNDVSIDETITLPTALIMDATGITYNIELFNKKDSVEIENPQALIDELTTSQFGLTQLTFTNTLTSDDFIITSNSIELLNNVETIPSANINMTVSTEGYSHWMTLVIYKDGVEYTRSNQHYASSSDTSFNFNLVGNSTIKDVGIYTFYVDYSNTDGQGNVTYTVLNTSTINLNIPVTSSGYEIQSQYIPKDEELIEARDGYDTLNIRLTTMNTNIQIGLQTTNQTITDIRDGTVSVGNAEKFNGEDADYYATQQDIDNRQLQTSISLWDFIDDAWLSSSSFDINFSECIYNIGVNTHISLTKIDATSSPNFWNSIQNELNESNNDSYYITMTTGSSASSSMSTMTIYRSKSTDIYISIYDNNAYQGITQISGV